MAKKNLLRKPLRDFKPYVAGKPIEEVRREYNLKGRIAKLASNENPLGVSPMALEAMHKALDDVALYPDDNAYYYRKKLAEFYGVELDNVFSASGSVEVLELAGISMLNPGDSVVTSERTFPIYYMVALKAGADLKLAPMTDGGYKYDLEAIANLIDETTKIVFLANPTNPTGTWFESDEFDKFMEKVPEDVLVVYDSAYEEFVSIDNMPDWKKHFDKGRRIMLSRTFSKAQGLAGIRVGYAIGPKDMIHALMTCRFPFNANLVAQAGAMAAMDDHKFIKESFEHNKKELDFMRDGLKDLPITVVPSQTNFLLIDTDKDAGWLFEQLQKVGIIVRPQTGVGLPKAVRVNTGLREDNENFLKYFRKLILSDEGNAK